MPWQLNARPPLPHGYCPKPNAARLVLGMGSHSIGNLLADKKHIYGAQVEVVEEWECRKAIIGRMLASVKLKRSQVNRRLYQYLEEQKRTMTVFPLYWIM